MNNVVFTLLIILIIFISLIGDYENRQLRKDINENKNIISMLKKEIGGLPLKNKVIIVRSIKDYDYSAYRKDIEALNEYLDRGWSIVNHESDEFVHTYILGMPLKWIKEGDMNDEWTSKRKKK